MKNKTIIKRLNYLKAALRSYQKGITKAMRKYVIDCIFRIAKYEELLIASMAKVKQEKINDNFTSTDYFQQIFIYRSFFYHGFHHLVLSDFERFLRQILNFMKFPKDSLNNNLKLLIYQFFENYKFKKLSLIDADDLWILLHSLEMKLREFTTNKHQQLSLFEGC